jgi:hypothetical protein
MTRPVWVGSAESAEMDFIPRVHRSERGFPGSQRVRDRERRHHQKRFSNGPLVRAHPDGEVIELLQKIALI